MAQKETSQALPEKLQSKKQPAPNAPRVWRAWMSPFLKAVAAALLCAVVLRNAPGFAGPATFAPRPRRGVGRCCAELLATCCVSYRQNAEGLG